MAFEHVLVSLFRRTFPESFNRLYCLQSVTQDGDVSSWGINLVTLSLAGGPSHTYTVGLIIMCSFEIRCSNTVCNICGGGRVLKRLSQNLPPVKRRQLENANAPLGHLCLSIQPFFRVPHVQDQVPG